MLSKWCIGIVIILMVAINHPVFGNGRSWCDAVRDGAVRDDAVRDDDVERVKVLLGLELDINETIENGFTAIDFANDLAIVELLLARHPKLDIRNVHSEGGLTPLEFMTDEWARLNKKPTK